MSDSDRPRSLARPFAALLTFLTAASLTLVVHAAPQARQSAATAQQLPPISWTCRMHPEVLETEKGRCPICKMELVPIRLDTVYSCPVHAVITEHAPGKCRICGRELIQLTMAVSWTCKGQPDVDKLEPGTCADGTPMVAKYTPRPHGNHNPQHGGVFFMAPDNWHHLEGTYPAKGVFRIHLYDDYTKPLPLAKEKLVKARVVTEEKQDPATHKAQEVQAFPLKLAANGKYLEAKIPPVAPPANMTAKIKFDANGPEYRFDFAFPDYSKEPAPAAGAVKTASAAPATSAPAASSAPAPSPTTSAPADTATAVVPTDAGIATPGGAAYVPTATASTVPEALAGLSKRSDTIKNFIAQRDFAEIWVPALEAKDLALQLGTRITATPQPQRDRATLAINRLVRASWLLDAFGDMGDLGQITVAYNMFSSAVGDLQSTLGSQGR